MEENTLVIMAAGLGSRFGGIKQLTPVGPGGEIIMEYSIFDAIEAGFTKVLFIIRRDIENDFKEIIGDRISKYIKTDYVIQDIDALPVGFARPEKRVKPWGTAQAVLACMEKLDGPFAVINADDYYGKEGFVKIFEFLNRTTHRNEAYHYCMAGFILGNTLSDFGAVTRGVCQVSSDGRLTDICEIHGIEKEGDTAFYYENDIKIYIDMASKVSMNMWGFSADLLPELKKRFSAFLSNLGSKELTAEYLLPEVVGDMLKEDLAQVTVLETSDRWFGVTFPEDKALVIQSFQKLVEAGKYPARLFT